MRVARRDGSASVGWVAGPPSRSRWCPRWKSCGPPHERRDGWPSQQNNHAQDLNPSPSIYHYPLIVCEKSRKWESVWMRSVNVCELCSWGENGWGGRSSARDFLPKTHIYTYTKTRIQLVSRMSGPRIPGIRRRRRRRVVCYLLGGSTKLHER